MKAKKLISVLALALAATTFSACGDQSVTFGHYWFKDSLTKEENFFEQAEYIISSKSAESSYANYEVSYEGTFVTTLEYSATEDIYTFSTKLDVKATFKVGETEQTVDDSAESQVKIDASSNALRPISSSKKMYCHTPISGTFDSADKCYVIVDYEYSTAHGTDKDAGDFTMSKCEITNNAGEKFETTLTDTFDFVKNYTFMDNEQILVATRAFAPDTTSATLSTYSAFAKGTQKVKFSFTDAEENATEAFHYTLVSADGTENSAARNILCRTAKINLDQKNPGATQTIKFAKTTDAGDNDYRNVILEITAPLAYSMGEIYYKLNKVSYKKN